MRAVRRQGRREELREWLLLLPFAGVVAVVCAVFPWGYDAVMAAAGLAFVVGFGALGGYLAGGGAAPQWEIDDEPIPVRRVRIGNAIGGAVGTVLGVLLFLSR